MNRNLKTPALVILGLLFSIIVFVSAGFLLKDGVRIISEQWPWVGEVFSPDKIQIKSLVIVPIGILGVNAVAFLLEILSVGWRDSALRRFLFAETKTARSDLFYFFLRFSGGMHVLGFVFTFGMVYVVAERIGESLNLNLLSSVKSLGLQFLVVVLVKTFIFYWAHRLMHVSKLFEVHKVHHSALELNVLTPLRNHPVDFVIMLLINCIPEALLGADARVVTVYLGLNGLYQCLVHSNLKFLERPFIQAIVITPAMHRVHHSCLQEHFDKNFGILTIWDYLFGTLHPAVLNEEVPLGVGEDHTFNTDRHWGEMVDVTARWMRGFSSKP